MAGLISGAIRSVIGITGRDLARANTLTTAEADAVSAGINAATATNARLLLENRVVVGEHPGSGHAVFSQQTRERDVVDAHGNPIR